ncbi:MAG: spore cortex biosynthesis protein YabQ [Candidatus Alkaliphilus sp. MAG34]|nr:spore cortex biosynthesis protein YabQ [Clostridiales bacterium]
MINLYIYSLSQETYILLITICGGILIGFMYDLYRIFRGLFKPKKIATMLQDLVFWVFIFIVAFYVLVFSNEGAIRYYNFLGFTMGAGFYHFSLSALAIKGMLFLIRSIKNFILDTFKIIKYPLSVTLCLITGPYNCCKKQIKPLYYKARRIGSLPKNIVRDTGKAIGIYFKKK